LIFPKRDGNGKNIPKKHLRKVEKFGIMIPKAEASRNIIPK
jgi:hypothetical protein